LLEKQLINNNFFNNLTKSSLYGGSGGNDFNDLESIKSQTPNNQSIKSIKLKKITIHSCSDIIQFLQFTYQVETDQKTLEIQGQEIGTKDDGQNR
jgi:hypothetical protein